MTMITFTLMMSIIIVIIMMMMIIIIVIIIIIIIIIIINFIKVSKPFNLGEPILIRGHILV